MVILNIFVLQKHYCLVNYNYTFNNYKNVFFEILNNIIFYWFKYDEKTEIDYLKFALLVKEDYSS